MNSLREVVWSEFAAAALAVVTQMGQGVGYNSYDNDSVAARASLLADALMDEFDKRFPQEQMS